MSKSCLLILAFWFGFAPLIAAAESGPTPLPKDEHGVEQDLEEDDQSLSDVKVMPLPNKESEPPAELTPATEPSAPKVTSETAPNDPTIYRQGGSSGEPIFDWDKHRGETEVQHPFGEKGLIRISKDRTYYYRVDESTQTRAASVHFGAYDPTNLSNPDGKGATAKFANNYDQSSNPAIIFEYEWQGWRSALGKFGLRLGSGIFVAQGHGHFVNDYNAGKTPQETFTFAMFPNTLGVVYRFHLWHRQLLVPYAEGGGVAFAFSELRDDNKSPKFGGSLGAYGAAGLAFNMTYFDYLTRIQLDREYGINACYLTVEYRHIQALTTRYDFTSEYINGGFLMEF